MIQRSTLMRIHMLLAAFVLPVAIMFLITGGFYTWGQKGSYVSESVDLTLDQPLKYLAAFFAISLLLILLSGFLMAMQLPRYRGQALAAMAAGFAVFIVAVLNS